MTRYFLSFLIPSFCLLVFLSQPAAAFCGFYVAKADADLFNQASKVILARAEDRTVITMANDFQGDVDDFALVVPVPTVITEKQVNVTENSIIDHLDAYTAPRLVEYFDDNPCQRREYEMMAMRSMAPTAEDLGDGQKQSARSLGVTIEEEYTVGEYDIQVLSATQSDGLLTFLNQEGYKLPEKAESVLGSYIKQDVKFFIAKVNIEEFEQSGYTYLRPLQVAFEDEKFMLPIRLGTVNAKGPQDLLLFTLTQNGRVETTNYRTVKIPTGQNIPLFVEDEFGEFYKAMFAEQVEKENMETVFLEYAWDMSWCDPCAADPLPNEDLRTLGVWWIDAPQTDRPSPMPRPQNQRGITPPQPTPVDVFVTRLHVRYTAEKFPEDLILQETGDRQNFQGRYVLQHPYTGEANCPAGREYFASLPERFEKEAQTLAKLTDWDIAAIRNKMEKHGQDFNITTPETTPWWERIWE